MKRFFILIVVILGAIVLSAVCSVLIAIYVK